MPIMLYQISKTIADVSYAEKYFQTKAGSMGRSVSRGVRMPQNEAVVHLIDDEEAVRFALGFLLETVGYEVHVYASANAFLEALPLNLKGCIVTDIRMPGIDGIELLRRLSIVGVKAPVIAISGHADAVMVAEAKSCGALCVIKKPFTDDAILSAITTALHLPNRPGGHPRERIYLVGAGRDHT